METFKVTNVSNPQVRAHDHVQLTVMGTLPDDIEFEVSAESTDRNDRFHETGPAMLSLFVKDRVEFELPPFVGKSNTTQIRCDVRLRSEQTGITSNTVRILYIFDEPQNDMENDEIADGESEDPGNRELIAFLDEQINILDFQRIDENLRNLNMF